MVTTQLICAFVFARAKSRFSYDTAQLKKGVYVIDRWIYFVNISCILLFFNLAKFRVTIILKLIGHNLSFFNVATCLYIVYTAKSDELVHPVSYGCLKEL